MKDVDLMIKEIITNIKVLRSLKSNVWFKTSELVELQERKFKMLLNHAYHNVPYYRRLFDSVGIRPNDIKNCEDISRIPITTKRELRDAKETIIARDTKIWAQHKTSGSTGMLLILYFTMEDAIYSRGMYERARVENGFRILRDKLAYIGSPLIIPKTKKLWERFGIRRKEGISVFEPLDKQVEKLKKVRPDALWGYASSIKLLAKIIKERGIEGISPRLIFTCSELLDPETRNLINSAFKVNLIDAYAAWEGGCMAWECSEHAGYHMNMDQVLMEFVGENGKGVKRGERGKVVITNLQSFAMPIIRYELGDYATPTYEECRCGRGGYLIKGVEGRCDDFIKLSDNRVVAPTTIFSIMKFIQGISEFQIVQEKEGELLVYIVGLTNSDGRVISMRIEEAFNKILGGEISVKANVVDRIDREKSGKLRSVISRI
jgi:phenylacetate-CoA ligase